MILKYNYTADCRTSQMEGWAGFQDQKYLEYYNQGENNTGTLGGGGF